MSFKRPLQSTDMRVIPLLASLSSTPTHHHNNGQNLLGRARRLRFYFCNVILALFVLACMHTHSLRDQESNTRPFYVTQALQLTGVRVEKAMKLSETKPTTTSTTQDSDSAISSSALTIKQLKIFNTSAISNTVSTSAAASTNDKSDTSSTSPFNIKRGTLADPSVMSTTLVTTAQQVANDAALDALEVTSNVPPSYCITDEDIAAAPKHHIFVAAPLFNSFEYVEEFLESIESQSYPHVTVVIYDDASDDGSADLVASRIPDLSYEAIILRGNERRGPSYAKWVLMRTIRRLAAPMDIVLFIDGDDKFFHDEVLDEVAATFRKEKPWFAYGRIRGYYEEQCGPPPPIVYHPHNQSSSVRTSAWSYCHPRVFRAFLLHHFEENDFRDPASERWLLKYTDRQMVYKALELSGDKKVAFMDGERPHVYYRMTGNSTVYMDKKIKETDLMYVQALVARTEGLPEPIHIISCAYKRVSLLKDVLTANIDQQNVDKRPVYLHVCNNGDDAQAVEIESILKSIKGLAGYRVRTFHDNPGGFARFYMMQDAVQEFSVDYFVMLDDDIKLPVPNGLRDLVAEARPQEYNSWWGRHFKGPMADYHSSKLTPPDLKAGKISGVTKFHYAGTGLSVIDADIIRFYFPLLEKVREKKRRRKRKRRRVKRLPLIYFICLIFSVSLTSSIYRSFIPSPPNHPLLSRQHTKGPRGLPKGGRPLALLRGPPNWLARPSHRHVRRQFHGRHQT